MDSSIRHFLDVLTLGEPQTFENMTVYPLFVPQNGGPAYLVLKEAMEQQLISITEVNESGSVPELKVINRSEGFVLLLDGEELAGAKQNRVLNTSVLLKGQSETVIPVSCTERGRWNYRSAEFQDSDVIMACRVRSDKVRSVSDSLKRELRHHSDQGKVWEEIHRMQEQAGVDSATSAMKDVYEARQGKLQEYLAKFSLLPAQQGLMVGLDGKVAGMDVLSRAEAFRLVFPKLIKSYAMEALLEDRKVAASQEPDSAAFLAALTQSQESRFDSPGAGYDYRYEGKELAGSALAYEGHVIHLACFSLEPREKEEPFAGFRRRRDFRRRSGSEEI
jgi:hypothetical protein